MSFPSSFQYQEFLNHQEFLQFSKLCSKILANFLTTFRCKISSSCCLPSSAVTDGNFSIPSMTCYVMDITCIFSNTEEKQLLRTHNLFSSMSLTFITCKQLSYPTYRLLFSQTFFSCLLTYCLRSEYFTLRMVSFLCFSELC